jgi:hypothetical protein
MRHLPTFPDGKASERSVRWRVRVEDREGPTSAPRGAFAIFNCYRSLTV